MEGEDEAGVLDFGEFHARDSRPLTLTHRHDLHEGLVEATGHHEPAAEEGHSGLLVVVLKVGETTPDSIVDVVVVKGQRRRQQLGPAPIARLPVATRHEDRSIWQNDSAATVTGACQRRQVAPANQISHKDVGGRGNNISFFYSCSRTC